MSTVELIAAIVLFGWLLGWLFHRRSARAMTRPLLMLAIEKNGTLKKANFFTLPKLCFVHRGQQVEVSSASTGISGRSERYTYVLLKGLEPEGFEFRILPRSVQTAIDQTMGLRKAVYTGDVNFDKMFSMSSNDQNVLTEVLNDGIRADLLGWALEKPQNKIADIRNYEDQFIFCVRETPKDHAGYHRLLSSATAFHDALRDVLERRGV